MSKEQLKTGETPFIRVPSCGGDLVVRGWDDPVMRVKGEDEIVADEKGFTITAGGTLTLYVPVGAMLSVGDVQGDLIIKRLEGAGTYENVHGDVVLVNAGDSNFDYVRGDLAARKSSGALTVGEVGGDVAARGIDSATFQTIHGDIAVRHTAGDLMIHTAHGDCDLRHVAGNVTIEQSHRDVNMAYIGGEVNVRQVTGDVRLRGSLADGDHSVEAQGDVIVRWPEGQPINLIVNARRVDNRLPLEDQVEKNGSLTGRIGQGRVNLNVTSSGRTILKPIAMTDEKWGQFEGDIEFDFETEMAGMAARIEAEVNTHLSRITDEMGARFGPDFGQRFAEKFTRQTERVVERARRRADTRGRTAGADFVAPPPAKKSVSTEEQLKILKMVETGKISPVEAGMLLEALEG